MGLILTQRRAQWREAKVESGARTQPSWPPSRRRGIRRRLLWLAKLGKVTGGFRRRNQNIFTLAKGAWARLTGDEMLNSYLNLHMIPLYVIYALQIIQAA